MCFSSGSGGMEIDAIKLARLLGKEMEVVLLCKEGEFIHHSHQGVNRDYKLNIRLVSQAGYLVCPCCYVSAH